MTTFKRYLVKANSNNEHFNADLDYAILHFSKELFSFLSELRVAFAEQQKKFTDISSWAVLFDGVSFISYEATKNMLGEELFEQVNDAQSEELFKLPDAATVDPEKVNVELSDEMVVSADGVWWKIHPKHSEITLGTDFVPWAWFSQCHNCGLRREEHARGKCLFTSTRYCAEAPGLARRPKARRKRSPDGVLPELLHAGEGSR